MAPRLVRFGAAALLLAAPAASDENTSTDDSSTKKLGVVSSVFTYGSPATASPALENLNSPDGCFPGLRVFSETVYGALGEWRAEDAASAFNPHSHAKGAVLVLHKPGTDSEYYPCPDPEASTNKEDQLPDIHRIFEVVDWGLHSSHMVYLPSLMGVQVNGQVVSMKDPFHAALVLDTFAYLSYWESNEEITKLLQKSIPGWVLVDKQDATTWGQSDPIIIMQLQYPAPERIEQKDECVLSFAGTNSLSEFSSSLQITGNSFCGFDNVHHGYAEKLREIAKDVWPAVGKTLSHCKRVTCTGHSMGGSLCELWAACVNSKRFDNEDFKLLSWNQEDVRAMAPLYVPPENTAGPAAENAAETLAAGTGAATQDVAKQTQQKPAELVKNFLQKLAGPTLNEQKQQDGAATKPKEEQTQHKPLEAVKQVLTKLADSASKVQQDGAATKPKEEQTQHKPLEAVKQALKTLAESKSKEQQNQQDGTAPKPKEQ